jgi:uncharacterized protein (TIGR03086 family)
MSEQSDRYRTIADGFTERVRAVPTDAWDNPTPCEGWVARDIPRHLVEWLPGFFAGTYGIEFGGGPSVDDDPLGAWTALDASITAALADPTTATGARDTPMGPMSFEAALDMIGTGDILIHTWDLARSTGLDDRLDPDAVHRMVEGMEATDVDAMRNSGHFGPQVEVPADADEQSQLLAFMGRDPGFTPGG